MGYININMVSQVALIVSLILATVIGAQPLLSNSVEFDIYHPENPEFGIYHPENPEFDIYHPENLPPEFDIYHPENLPPELPPTPPTLPTQRPSRRSTLPPAPPTLPTERPTRRRRTSQRPTWEKPSDDKNCWKRVCKKRRINGKTRRTCTFVREYIQHL